AEDGGVADGALDGQPLVLIARRLEEVDERDALAVGVRVDERLVGCDGRRADGAGRADGVGEVRAREVLEYLLGGDEEERLILLYRPARVAAELLAVEVRQGLAVGRVRRQSFEPLEVEERAVELVGARLGD